MRSASALFPVIFLEAAPRGAGSPNHESRGFASGGSRMRSRPEEMTLFSAAAGGASWIRLADLLEADWSPKMALKPRREAGREPERIAARAGGEQRC